MKKKILVVDDDEDILEPLALLLESEGYLVETIAKGERTQKRVASFKPDLILLDVLMSGSDGREICKQLKATAKTKKIPVILMSAHPGASKDSIDAGADAFIAKPFETVALLELIKEHNG